MTDYTVDSWEEMQNIKAEIGDTVTLRGTGFSYIAMKKPEINDCEATFQKDQSGYERTKVSKMTYPSQALYKKSHK